MNDSEDLKAYKKAVADDPVVHIEDATERRGEYTTPYPIGYECIDNAIMGGVREGDFIGITGDKGGGKTTCVQNISVNLSLKGHSCLWFSYELLNDNLYAKFKDMGYSGKELLVYMPKRKTTGNLSWIKEKIIEGKEKFGTKFIFIDHLDFLAPTKTSSTDQFNMYLKNICLELKNLAIELKVIIFLIAHLKKIEGRAATLNDISGTSGVADLADLVLSVSRERIYETKDGLKTEIRGKVGLVRILKNRITGNEEPYMNYLVSNNRIMPTIESDGQNKKESEYLNL